MVAEKKLQLTVVVHNYQMKLLVAIGEEHVLLPWAEAQQMREELAALVPYRHQTPVYVTYEFHGEEVSDE